MLLLVPKSIIHISGEIHSDRQGVIARFIRDMIDDGRSSYRGCTCFIETSQVIVDLF